MEKRAERPRAESECFSTKEHFELELNDFSNGPRAGMNHEEVIVSTRAGIVPGQCVLPECCEARGEAELPGQRFVSARAHLLAAVARDHQ